MGCRALRLRSQVFNILIISATKNQKIVKNYFFTKKTFIPIFSNGMAAMMSMPLLGFQLEAIYHTAIVYNGVEFYFGGGGIDQSRPGGTHLGPPMRRVKLGTVCSRSYIVSQFLFRRKLIPVLLTNGSARWDQVNIEGTNMLF